MNMNMFNIKIISAIVAASLTLFIALGASVYYYKGRYNEIKLELNERKNEIKNIKTDLENANNLLSQKIKYINLLNNNFEIDQNKTKHFYQAKIDKLLKQVENSNKSKDVFIIKENNNTCECEDIEDAKKLIFELNNKTYEKITNSTQGLNMAEIKKIERD